MAIPIYKRPERTIFQDTVEGGVRLGIGGFVGLCLVIGVPLYGIKYFCFAADVGVTHGLVPAINTEDRAHNVGHQGNYIGVAILAIVVVLAVIKIIEKLSSAKVEVKLPKAESHAHAPAGGGGDHGGHAKPH